MRPTTQGASAGVPATHPVSPDTVRVQMERALASAHFKSSPRCQTLLRFLVERTLAGEGNLLKERLVGIEVFGRAPDYDTSEDPVVRTAAGEVRKKLAQYYNEADHAGEVRIELHPGSYIPEFHVAQPKPAPITAPPAVAPSTSHRRVWIAAGVGVAALGLAVWLIAPAWRQSAVEKFWGPMLSSPRGVLFCLGQPRVYNLHSDAKQRDLERKIEGLSRESWESLTDTIPLNQLVPMWDRYVALGDAMCLLRMTSVFERRGKPYSIRGVSSTGLPDLRERPAVLIGAFDNEWTLRLVGQLRYTFYKDFQGLEIVRDRDNPTKNDWKLVNSWPYWDIPNDYAIVSRVLDRTTDRTVVIAAGITHFGTEAAGEFLSDANYFSEALPQLPADWPHRNLQIVLSVPVVHGAGGHPRVLATHVW